MYILYIQIYIRQKKTLEPWKLFPTGLHPRNTMIHVINATSLLRLQNLSAQHTSWMRVAFCRSSTSWLTVNSSSDTLRSLATPCNHISTNSWASPDWMASNKHFLASWISAPNRPELNGALLMRNILEALRNKAFTSAHDAWLSAWATLRLIRWKTSGHHRHQAPWFTACWKASMPSVDSATPTLNLHQT